MRVGNRLMSDLAEADRKEIARLWAQVTGSPLPARLHLKFARRELAWRLQSGGKAGMPDGFVRKLDAAALKHARTRARGRDRPVPGSKLYREWRGTLHEVEVLESGYRHQGQAYASLSRIAQVITGAHWSGPRFFGLKTS